MSTATDSTASVRVVIETQLGSVDLSIQAGQAPMSAAAFLGLVDDGSFTQHGTFYRAVRKGSNDLGSPSIDVIQGGWRSPPALPTIVHETTVQSGLRHLEGTVSLARGAAGTATGTAFFICLADEPALDAGGARHKDGLGFAAFGRVIAGMDIVRRIHRSQTCASADDPYMRGQILDPPILIVRAYRPALATTDNRAPHHMAGPQAT